MAARPVVALVADEEVAATLREAARALCCDAFGDRFTADDWDHSCGGVRVLVTDGPDLVAHAAVVERRLDVGGHPVDAGYVEAVAVRPDRWRQGLGRRAMERVAAHIRGAYQLGVLSTAHQQFYEELGWERWLGPSFVRQGGRLLRTADEDAGLMALRRGRGAAFDLSSSITCDERSGDDW